MITCLDPHTIWNKYTGSYMSVPCGKCDACRSLQANGWSNRLELETSFHKYCVFVTLTYTDDKIPSITLAELRSTYDSDTLEQSIVDSSEFLALNYNRIYHHSVRDIQLFFKKLRINLVRKLHLNEKERLLRYFVAFEYGPTTFRPHYHLLVWFDSDKIVSAIKEFIYKAWQHANSCTSLSTFLRRNRISFVRESCSSYVAGYLNTDTHLPAILREVPFRTKHLQSSAPPIGLPGLQFDSLREYIFGDLVTISFKRPTTLRYLDVPLWRSYESRYFPRCPRFSSLSSVCRRALYTFSSFYGRDSDFKEFFARFIRDWYTVDSPAFSLFRQILSFDSTEIDSGYPSINKDSVKRLFYLSRRFTSVREAFGLSASDFLQRIESYYGRKELYKLGKQLSFEAEYARNTRSSLSHIPCIIDPLFYENKRSLPLSTYQLYLSQFAVPSFDGVPWLNKSPLYQAKKVFYEHIREQNTKTRVKKEFVALHPEFQKMYLQNSLIRLYGNRYF